MKATCVKPASPLAENAFSPNQSGKLGNVGMKMICAGHYATETFGVKALARELSRALGVKTVFV